MIGKVIKETRIKKGYSLSELAERAKISKSYLSNIERNLNQNPSIQVMKKIAVVLDVELNSLLITDNQEQLQELEILNKWHELVDEIRDLDLEKEQIEEFRMIVEYLKWRKKGVR